MSIQKKSLISTLHTAKKANVATTPATTVDASKSVKASKMIARLRKHVNLRKHVSMRKG